MAHLQRAVAGDPDASDRGGAQGQANGLREATASGDDSQRPAVQGAAFVKVQFWFVVEALTSARAISVMVTGATAREAMQNALHNWKKSGVKITRVISCRNLETMKPRMMEG